jgi:hypothetical protein
MLRIEILKRPDGSGLLRCTREDSSVTWQKQKSNSAFFALHDPTHYVCTSSTVLGVSLKTELDSPKPPFARSACPKILLSPPNPLRHTDSVPETDFNPMVEGVARYTSSLRWHLELRHTRNYPVFKRSYFPSSCGR